MSASNKNTGGKRLFNSLGIAKGKRDRLLGRIIAGYTGWFLILFILLIYLVSGEPRIAQPAVLWWLAFYAVYLILLEALSRLRSRFYEGYLFRMLRVQITLAFGTVLIYLSYGSESPFWFVYLWPILATAIYFESRLLTFGVYLESAVLYVLASLAVAEGPQGIDFTSLLVNVSITLVLSAVLHVLVETVQKYQVAETELGRSGLFQQIQEDIDRAIDLQDVLDRILRWAVRLVDARDGSLMLMEEGELRFRARFGGSVPAGKMERTFKLGEGVAGWVAANRRPYVCRDTWTDDTFVPIIEGMPIRSIVSAPIISHGEVLGVINVDSSEPNRFSGADAQLLVALANQTAVAIERAELWDGLRKIGEKTLGGAGDLYEHVVDSVHHLAHCPVAMWQVNEKNRRQARIRASRGLREEYAAERVLDLEHSVTGKAIQAAQPIQVEHIQEDPDVSPQTKIEAKEQGWESLLVVPLLIGPGRAVGSLSIYSPTKKRFAPWEIDLLSTFAGQTSVAIQNADRLQTIQQLYEVGRSLTTLQRSPEILQETLLRIANTAMEVLGADLVDLYQYQADTDHFALPPVMVGERRCPHLVPGVVLPDDVVAQIAHTGEPIYASRAQDHPVLAGDWESSREGLAEERFVVREGIVSSAGVPVKVGEEVVGVVFASYRRKQDLDAETELRERIEAFAGFAGVAIQNARLLQRERELRREAETLRQVSGTIGSKEELSKITNQILDELGEMVEYRTASLQLVQGDYRTLLAGRGFHIGTANRYLLRPISKDPLIRRVMQGKEPLVLPHPGQDPDWRDLSGTHAIKSWIGVPLVYNQEVVGLLTIDHDQPGFYSKDLSEPLAAFANRVAVDIRNAHVFDSTQRRIRDLEIINTVLELIGTKLETKELLQTIVSQIAQRLECSHCTAFFPETENGETVLVPRATYGARSELIWSRRFKPDEGLIGWVFQRGRSLVLGNAKEDPRFAPSREEQDKPRSMLVVPIKVGDQTIGIISADQDEYGWFGESERSLVEALAGQTGVAIQRSLGLDLLREIGDRISRADKVGDILQHIVEGAIELTNTTAGVIYLLSEDGHLVVQSFEHPPDFQHPPPRMGERGITRRIFETGRIMEFPDIHRDPLVNPKIHDRIRSMVGVPLKLEEKAIGVLFLNDKELHYFTETEKSLLSTLASQAAIAIENTRLYERLARRVQELEALTLIGKTVSSLGIDGILDLVYEQMCEVINLEDAQVQFAIYDREKDEVSFPLAMEQDGGKVIDIIRYGKREAEYSDTGKAEPVEQLKARRKGTRFGLTEYVMDLKKPVLLVDEFKQPMDSSEQVGEDSFLLTIPSDHGRSLKPKTIRVWRTFGCHARPTNSWLGVPMIVKDQAIGIISIQSLGEERPVDEQQLEVLTTLTVASQAAVALENARLYERLEVDLRMTEKQREALRSLLGVNQIAGRFVHRVNQLAGTIPLDIEFVQDYLDPSLPGYAEANSGLEDIKKQIRQLLDMASRIRDSARKLEQSRYLQQVEANELMDRALAEIRGTKRVPSWGSKINPTREYAQQPLIIETFGPLLREALGNMISNAIEAMPNGGNLILHTERKTVGGNECAAMAVIDEGEGITEEHLDRIFALGYSTKPGGFGYGLWLVKQICEATGAQIEVTSTEGKGSAFTISAPLAMSQMEVR